MAKFTIRVELHNATRIDYDDLAKRLARHSITDEILASDGKRYKLPPAEYNYVGNATLDQVYDTVKTVAESVGRKFAILANEVTSRNWVGLQLA